jgi:hypothetical protein
MAGVELHTTEAETPTQRMAGDENRVRKVTDAAGRVIGWRPLLPLEDMDLAELAGAENAENRKWMLYATCAFVVVEIDGDPIPKPRNKLQLRAVVQRLGKDGLASLIDAMLAEAGPTKDDAAELEAAKN